MPTTTAFRGGVSVTGVKPGDTSLVIHAATVSKTIPVTVYENLFPKFTGAGLTQVGDASYDVEYTGTTWQSFGSAKLTLEAGDYSLEDSVGFNADSSIYFTLINNADSSVFLRTNDSGDNKRRMRATLKAGDYKLTFAGMKAYSGTVTPILRKLT